MSFTVAIDGPAAAGKGTLAKQLAAHFKMAHLDTGLLYRAVARQVLAGSDPVAAAVSLQAADLDPTGLYTSEVAQQASRVAVLAEVRSALVTFQRSFAQRAEGAVLDGRDIGTVICCDAEVKLFVTARAEVRAERRYLELKAKGADVSLAQVLADVNERDARDQGRKEAPLCAASDAIVIDTSDLSAEVVLDRAIAEVVQKWPSGDCL
ncbi:MAG: d(CMP) kinase [Paracoccaceae bacterium]|nr:d(CMP) kinase [Paracoccaceae bacterium]